MNTIDQATGIEPSNIHYGIYPPLRLADLISQLKKIMEAQGGDLICVVQPECEGTHLLAGIQTCDEPDGTTSVVLSGIYQSSIPGAATVFAMGPERL